MRQLLVSLTVALALSLTSLGVAFGHVHRITPLLCLTTDNATHSGARTAQGGPITGIIPNAVGNANLTLDTLGQDAAPCPPD
jgi:hypothetical protein